MKKFLQHSACLTDQELGRIVEAAKRPALWEGGTSGPEYPRCVLGHAGADDLYDRTSPRFFSLGAIADEFDSTTVRSIGRWAERLCLVSAYGEAALNRLHERALEEDRRRERGAAVLERLLQEAVEAARTAEGEPQFQPAS